MKSTAAKPIPETDEKPPEGGEPMYTVKGYCAAKKIGPSKFYELVRDGKLKVVKIGSATRIPYSEDQRFIKQSLAAGKAEFDALAEKKRENKAKIDAARTAKSAKRR